ncbi:uncharacterized protein ACNS7B_020110 [Menidia menidia]
MSSVQRLREFISQRLTAAAQEIFTEFEKTIVHYEDEIHRQRRLLESCWEPRIILQRVEAPREDVRKTEEFLADQQLCIQEKSSGPDQQEAEPEQIAEDREESGTGQDGGQFVLKEETDPFMVSTAHQDAGEAAPKTHRVLEVSGNPPDLLNTADLSVQQVCTQERSSGLDQEKSELLEMKEEQEELCTELEAKQKTENVMLTPSYEDSDLSEAEPNGDQLLPQNCCLTESQSQKGGNHTDLRSTIDKETNPKNTQQRNGSARNNVADTTKNSVECEFCEKSFTNENNVTPHACRTCRKSCDLISRNIQNDEKWHSWKRCGKGFSKNSILLRSHTDEKLCSCEMCGNSFSQHGHSLKHLRMHTGEKLFSCKTCGKSFTRKTGLLIHMRIHTGERPFPCGTCGRNFTQRAHLLAHMRIHTGERPYSCGMCGKDFSRRGSLRIHMRVHQGKDVFL